MPSGSISYPLQPPRPRKRHRSRTNLHGDKSNSTHVGGGGSSSGLRAPESSLLQIHIGDEARLAEWYKSAFMRLQQVACRLVAKAWIKKIHPKKVSCSLNQAPPIRTIADNV